MDQQPKTSQKIQQLIAEWEAMIGCHVPRPLQPHMSASLYGMRQVLEEVQAMEERAMEEQAAPLYPTEEEDAK